MNDVVVHCSYGPIRLSVGDTFDIDYNVGSLVKGEYTIDNFTGVNIYSPSRLGGVTTIWCSGPSGNIEFCGDSVAHFIHRKRNPGCDSTQLKALAAG